ncbi:5'-methylthioadenosine/adenosylhomocysteine nucleosidase [Enterococcus sp. CSURQ0835]|uniref:5'-methylthioadenosine/adenosylhomocysteine nucleosidase n=1 Tax=Enterococcus sp. CSURQ0835 TaxID=2681394 RepID=UPI001356D7D1|nr:5'-methylthioadenosine/adenosylhomocysteine nucleosidase [Enterococcus sp. CSURQ0835]
MKIGIIGAMEEEIKSLRERLDHPLSWEQAGALFISGSLGNHEVIVVRSGIGKVLASITTTLLIHQYKVNMVINTGTAGGIGSGLAIGDLVVADKVAYYDVDATTFGYKIGQVPGMPLYYDSSVYLRQEMIKTAEKVGQKVHEGLIVSGDSFISSPEKTHAIKQNFPDALALEMESTAIGQTAAQFGIPFLILRALSDTADQAATETHEEFVEHTGKASAELVTEFVQHLK